MIPEERWGAATILGDLSGDHIQVLESYSRLGCLANGVMNCGYAGACHSHLGELAVGFEGDHWEEEL